MNTFDIVLISQSEVVNYDEYSRLPLDRLPLFEKLVYPRMLRMEGGFRSHLDVLNRLEKGLFWSDATAAQRRDLLSIWNLPGYSGVHLANYLSQFGLRARVINNIDAEWDLFEQACDHAGPRPLVGISSTFHLSFAETSRLVKAIRARVPAAEFVLGGAFVNDRMTVQGPGFLARAMRKLGVAFALHGFNSEQDLRDLLLARKAATGFSAVNNLLWTDPASGQVQETDCVWRPPVLDDMPDTWDRLDLPFVRNTLQLRTSSGCPYHCAFCSYPETARGYHAMSVERVLEHVASALRIPGVRRLVFIDDTFNASPRRFKEMLQGFQRFDFEWYSFLRAQFVDRDTASMMRDSGCRGVYLGVESANDGVLGCMNKKATKDAYAKGIAALKNAGVTTLGAFVLGFPGETADTIEENARFIGDTGLDFYTLKEFYYLENTQVHREQDVHGLTGMGNSWAHRTMDSDAAYQHKKRLFRDIKDSVFVDPDTSLWYLAYLQDNGFAMDDIATIQKLINKLMASQMGGAFDDHAPEFQLLADRLSARRKP